MYNLNLRVYDLNVNSYSKNINNQFNFFDEVDTLLRDYKAWAENFGLSIEFISITPCDS